MHNILQLLRFGRKTITNKLSIYIKTNTGRSLAVDLDPKWDIKEVKEFVAPQLGLHPDEVKIIFAGKELGDNIIIEVNQVTDALRNSLSLRTNCNCKNLQLHCRFVTNRNVT